MILHFIKKVGISFEVPLSDNLVDLVAIFFLFVFVVCYILSKVSSSILIRFCDQILNTYPF